MSEKELDEIIRQIDNDDNGLINYSEFIAATINVRKYLTKPRIEALFKSFDVDDNDEIDATNLKNAFTKLGKAISDEDVRTIMQEHDVNKDGKISLQEFEQMLLGCNVKENDAGSSQLLEK